MTYTVDDYTLALLHFEGSDGSTTITDEVSGNTWTASGTAQIDTAQYKYGSSSLLLADDEDYISVGDAAKWTFSGDFTIELWFRLDGAGLFPITCYFFQQYVDATHYMRFYLNGVSGYSHQFYFTQANGGSNTISAYAPNVGTPINPSASLVTLSGDTWYHIVLVRAASTYSFYLDDEHIGSVVDADVIQDFAADPKIGGDGTFVAGNVWIDEFRISNIARKTIVPITYKQRDTLLTFEERDTSLTYKPRDTSLTYEER